MGNCQAAADAEAVVIYHPGSGCNRSYKIYRPTSVAAEEIMVLYPGYYVALVGAVSTEDGIRLKQIRLLRPQDTLTIGRVYRLVSFEDVLLELSAKTRGKLVVRGGVGDEEEGGRCRKTGPSLRKTSRAPRTSNCCSYEVFEETVQIDIGNTETTTTTTTTRRESSASSISNNDRRTQGRPWRPSLQSISEFEIREVP
ncbi:hypothetical protein MLD38_009290 [Melastoma candidum]|uniref:Uncharacterized protein n=1 Tax=Melastoma candidum TaxID=119954 RepID=A0ACB9RYZ4_9MYRT|nr:hypothetical protein MLD38_009290 [Melastoma candidum]